MMIGVMLCDERANRGVMDSYNKASLVRILVTSYKLVSYVL